VLFVPAVPVSPVFSEFTYFYHLGIQAATPLMPISLYVGSTALYYSPGPHPGSSLDVQFQSVGLPLSSGYYTTLH
jgi:hypothetical protein